MDKIMKKAAEILFISSYAVHINVNDGRIVKPGGDWIPVEFDEDTLEGRRQADALEDWLSDNETMLWLAAHPIECKTTGHQWRLDRIKWCLEELTK